MRLPYLPRNLRHMLSQRFERLYAMLVGRWEAWWSTPRDPERVAVLAAARFALEDVRAKIAAERDQVPTRPAPAAARTSIAQEDRARLAVRAAGFQQN